MLGAIIGVLAADTYEKDKQAFYRQLVMPEAELSVFGETVLHTADALDKDMYLGHDDFVRGILKLREKYGDKWPHSIQIALMVDVVASWWYDSEDECLDRGRMLYGDDKEDFYAAIFVAHIIYRLRNGATKDEVYQSFNDESVPLGAQFKACRHEWNWQTQPGLAINYVMRAWNAFYHGFDFGSCIHNAARMEVGDRRLNCALTGAFAEAMYGCSCYYVKSKYSPDPDSMGMGTPIEIPDYISKAFASSLTAIKRQIRWQKIFMAKNDLERTNIERHNYIPAKSKFEGKIIDSELRRRILKSFFTRWGDRFGFYLDNGWIYCYRSGIITCRFRLKEANEYSYRIYNVQYCDKEFDTDRSLEATLYSATNNWGYLWNIYRYWNGDEMPKEYRDTIKENFWNGERMFYRTGQSIGDWLKYGRNLLADQKSQKLYEYAKRLGPERFGVAMYINELYAKWCPMEDLDWIFDY